MPRRRREPIRLARAVQTRGRMATLRAMAALNLGPVAAGALAVAGQPQLAVIFALLVVVNQVLLLVPGATEA